jgi:thymidylate kinase
VDPQNELSSDRKAKIAELEALAAKVLDLKKSRRLRHPLCIEFCGSPKAGKTTTIGSLNMFLRRNGFKIAVLQERAGLCPISNKTHPYFNIWTMCSLIAELLETLEKGKDKIDIVIADRGIFDALCWFRWQNHNPSSRNTFLSDEVYRDLSTFAQSEVWKRAIDLVYVFQVQPETSIQREYVNLLTEKRGSVMKESVLQSYNAAIDETIEATRGHFRQVEKLITDQVEMKNQPSLVNYEVTRRVLNGLLGLLDEQIAYFKKDNLGMVDSLEALQRAEILFANRSEVEANDDYVQPIAIAVVTDARRQKVLAIVSSINSGRIDSGNSGLSDKGGRK